MGSATKKAKKQVSHLRDDASDVWDEQRQVWHHASQTLSKAGDRFVDYAHSDLYPSVRKAYDKNVTPLIGSGVESAKRGATQVRDRVSDGVDSARGSWHSTSDEIGKRAGKAAKNASKKRDELLKNASKSAADAKKDALKRAGKLGIGPQRRTPVGRYVVLGIVLVAAVGVAYAAWQTLRADDDLWIEDEPEALDASGAETTAS